MSDVTTSTQAAAPAPAKPARAIDIGCGGGHVSYLMARHAGTVVAADLSSEMLAAVAATAKERGLANIETARASAEKLPFPDGSFDFAATRYSAHHWHDFRGGLREARRVLKAGSRAAFIDAYSAGSALVDTHLQAVELTRDPSHVRDYSIAEWTAALALAGFRIDVCHMIVKDKLLRDNPPGDWWADTTLERYDADRPELHDVLRRWRRIAEEYDPPRLLLGETYLSGAARLARFYGVPVDQLLPGDDGPAFGPRPGDAEVTDAPATAPEWSHPVRLALGALARLEGQQGELLTRFVRLIQVQRGDFNGQVLTVRRDDLFALACILDVTPEQVFPRLAELGVTFDTL